MAVCWYPAEAQGRKTAVSAWPYTCVHMPWQRQADRLPAHSWCSCRANDFLSTLAAAPGSSMARRATATRDVTKMDARGSQYLPSVKAQVFPFTPCQHWKFNQLCCGMGGS